MTNRKESLNSAYATLQQCVVTFEWYPVKQSDFSFCWPMAWRRGVETNGVVATPLTPARMLGQFIIISIIYIIIIIIIH